MYISLSHLIDAISMTTHRREMYKMMEADLKGVSAPGALLRPHCQRVYPKICFLIHMKNLIRKS